MSKIMASTSKQSSVDDKVKLPPTESISRAYQLQTNRKFIRVLTVAVYVLCVSLAAIMLSLYYIFVWDPNAKSYLPKVTSCDQVIIPEYIAIRLMNSTEITAEQFYKNLKTYHEKMLQRRQLNTSAPLNRTIESYRLQRLYYHRNYRRKNTRPSSTVTTSPSTTSTTTTQLLPTLATYQRKYLIGLNKDDEDDEDIEEDQNFDGSGQFLSNTDSNLS